MFLLLFLLTGSGISPAAAQGIATSVKFTSAYTDLHRDCKIRPDTDGRDGGNPVAACKPFRGYQVMVSYDVSIAGISITDTAGHVVAVLGNDYIGIGMQRELVEWRMADGRPFAAIFRIGRFDTSEYAAGNPYKAFNAQGSTLVIKGLRGCEGLALTMDGDTRNAAALARQYADEAFLK